MAVKKATKKAEVEVTTEEVVVEPTEDVTTTEESAEDVNTEGTSEELEELEETVEESTEEPEVKVSTETEPEIEVDTEVADVSKAPKEKNVRIKAKKDISFNFGSERYELKAGQCINVPVAVKLHLTKLDALAPL